MTGRRLTIACYVAGLTGLGHFRRMAAIAGTLAGAHDVVLVNAGRGSSSSPDVRQVDLPPLPTHGSRVEVPGPEHLCWAARESVIRELVGDVRPDVLIVEHYPFSKWALGREIGCVVAAVRGARGDAVALASVRDIVGRTRRERMGLQEFVDGVLARLEAFDGLLVHGDPELLPLAASFPEVDRIPVPVFHTGYVLDDSVNANRRHSAAGPALVAAGGGADQDAFLSAATKAARALAPGGRVNVVPGPFGSSPSGAHGREEYLAAMSRASWAITRAGYNTTVELWAAGVPAVLVPDRRMSDQAQRAEAFASRGAGVTLDEADLISAGADLLNRLSEAVQARGAIDVAGARRTRELVEAFARSRVSGGAVPD